MSPRTAQMTLTSRGIRIGIATLPRQSISMTGDAMLLQRALLAKPKPESKTRHWQDAAIYLIGVAVVLGLVIAGQS